MAKNDLTLIVMAAGEGKRLQPFTSTQPKPMIPIMSKPLIVHTLENGYQYFSQIVVVVGYKKEILIDYLGDNFKGVPISYVEQAIPKGTADALHQAISKVKTDSFVLLNGDDLYSRELFEFVPKAEQFVVGKTESVNWSRFGVIKMDKDNNLLDIVEKPSEFVSDLINIGFYKFKKSIDSHFNEIKPSVRGEYEINDLIRLHLQTEQVRVFRADSGWNPIGYPWDVLTVSELLLQDLDSVVEGTVEPNVVIRGRIFVSKGAVIKSGSYIEGNFYIGKNCVIGPNASLKEFGSIGEGSEIGNGVELTRSVLGTYTKVKHLAYVGDSVVGNKVNIAAGTITANLKHNHQPIRVLINGQKVDSNREKLGAFIADEVRTGVNTSIYPGVCLSSGETTLPGEVIKENR